MRTSGCCAPSNEYADQIMIIYGSKDLDETDDKIPGSRNAPKM